MMNDDSKSATADMDDVMDDFDHDDLVVDVRTRTPSRFRKVLFPVIALAVVTGVGGYLAFGTSQSAKQGALNSASYETMTVPANEPQAVEAAMTPDAMQAPEMVELENEVATTDLTEAVSAEMPDAGAAIAPETPVSSEEAAIIPVEDEVESEIQEQDMSNATMPDSGPLTPVPAEFEQGSADAYILAAQEPASGGIPPVVTEPAPEPQVLGMPTTMQSDPIVPVMPEPASVTEVTGAAGMPEGGLQQMTATPAPGAVSPAMPEATAGDVAGAGITSPAQNNEPDTYYDSRLNVPSGPLANSVGPRKVDPTLEPASKYVVARKTYDASDSESMIVAAGRALSLGRYESALEMYNQMYDKNKRDGRILMGRAIAQQHLGMDDVAILSYEELLELTPNNTEAIVNLMGLIQKQYPAVALRRLTDLQSKHPNNAGIAAQIGMAHAAAGDNKEALRALGTAASLEPTNALHVYNLAVVSDRMGSRAQAVNYYEQALEKDSVYGGGRSVPREKIYDRLSRLRAH